MDKNKKPIRMCVLCRTKTSQNRLIRLQSKNGKIIEFTKVGRSFYLCKKCIINDNKNNLNKLNKKINTKYQNYDEFGSYYSHIRDICHKECKHGRKNQNT